MSHKGSGPVKVWPLALLTVCVYYLKQTAHDFWEETEAALYLRQRAAGPGSAQSLAAGGRPGTRHRLVALGIVAQHQEGGHLAEPGRDGAFCSLVTRRGCQVADGAMRTAVQMVIATHSLEDQRRHRSHEPHT